MKTIKLMTRPIGIAAVLAFAMSIANAAPIEVRYSLWAKPGEAQYTAVEKFAEIVDEKSGGKFKVILFGGNQLGNEKEVLEQLAINTTQIGASGDPGVTELDYLSLPYLMKDMPNYRAVVESDFGKVWIERVIDESRIRILGILPRSARQVSADKVINSMADMKNLKIRVNKKDYFVQTFLAFGAKPTPMDFKEVYTSLQTGIIDGQDNPIETVWAMKFYEVQKGVAMVGHIHKPAWVKISERFWQSLSEEERGWFTTAQMASEQLAAELVETQSKEVIEKMEAAGITITYPDKTEWREATQSVRDELGTKVWGEETYKKIVEIGQKDY